jgi:hypothetical protein
VEPFRESWIYVLQQHSILRTSFHHQDLSVPIQCVHKSVTLPFEVLNYEALSPEEQERELAAFLAADKKCGFDFTQAPLLRVTLIRLSEDTYQMVLTHHHLLLDGWSLPVLLQELLSTYERLTQAELPVPRMEDRYEDYIQYVQSKDQRSARQFWQEYLHSVDTPSLLPFLKATQERNQTGQLYEQVKWVADPSLLASDGTVHPNTSPDSSTLIQGVWAYLLANYTGQGTVVYGVTVAGRPTELPDAEHRVGLYINTLPFRATLAEEQRVVDWLTGLQQGHSQAREYSYSPLTTIQGWLGLKGEWFDSLFVFENYPIGDAFFNPSAFGLRTGGWKSKPITP